MEGCDEGKDRGDGCFVRLGVIVRKTWVDLPDVVVVLERHFLAPVSLLLLLAAWRNQGVMCDPLLVSDEPLGDLR